MAAPNAVARIGMDTGAALILEILHQGKNREPRQMAETIKILLQSTIPYDQNDWHIGRFSLLQENLAAMRSVDGTALFELTARDREPGNTGNDPVLVALDELDFDEIWLTASDSGNGPTEPDCEGVSRFRKKGGGVLTTRDHQDLGSSICSIYGIGGANFFHTTNLEYDEARRIRDDRDTEMIDFPNYHSGRNGDYQQITAKAPAHPLLRRQDGTEIEYFPAHPHEGAVGVPAKDASASVVACPTSKVTGASFDLVVAFERSPHENGVSGRAAVHSSFHHFADYNWNPALGCPDFVSEAPGDGFALRPETLDDIKTYAGNLALWLAPM